METPFRPFLVVFLLHCLVPALAVVAADPNQSDYGAPHIGVTETEGTWTIHGQTNRVDLRTSDLRLTFHAAGVQWSMTGSTASDLVVETGGRSHSLCLAKATTKTIAPYETGFKTGVKVSLNGFDSEDAKITLSLDLFICLEGPSEELVCELIAREDQTSITECLWPAGLEADSFDATVVPFMQGMFLPKDWPEKVWLYDTMSYGRGLYMPWWGHQQGSAALLVLLETPDDGGCRFEHPAGGPTHMRPRWVHSLGKLRYPRRLRLCGFAQGNYVTLAKRYRQYVKETGHFVSLAEKIARNRRVEKLIGSPVIHTSILYHIEPESQYYHKDDPAKNDQMVTFDQRASQLRALSENGVKRAYVHLDGWGFRGYDNLHPDILPPCPDAGGWEGMKHLADACRDLGYVFAIHDQYRDYYLDAQSYDPRHAILDRNGGRPLHSIWYGGKQTVLCSRLALGHVKKNYGALLDHGIAVQGAYLDVFAVVPPDECYNPEHPATRSDCLAYRGLCFDFIRSTGGVVSSEEPADWAIPHLDLVHHGPYALAPNPGHGPAMGIPVPLFNLVYHDAICLPWSMGRGNWGIPEKDLGYLHGLANAGLPYLSLQPSDEELQRVRTMCALHERVGRLEMTKHEFLDESFRQWRTTFADGTTVTIDLDADTFEIAPPLGTSAALRTMQYTPRPAQEARTWQTDVRNRLAKRLKIDDLLQQRETLELEPKRLSSSARNGYRFEEIEINSTAGRRMAMVVTIPTSHDGLYPAVVCIGGHGSDLYSPYDDTTIARDPARMKTDHHYYKGFGTALATKGFVTISTTVSQHNVYEDGRLLMGERLWDLMRCVDYIESLPNVDKSRIACAGLSLGGEMAMWLGAMDERVAATVSAGFLTTMDHMEHDHCLCWKFDGLRELVDYADLYCLIAPRPLQCQNGVQEPPSQFFVPLARQALQEIRPIYNDMGVPENVTLDVHEGGHVIDLHGLLYFLEKNLHVH